MAPFQNLRQRLRRSSPHQHSGVGLRALIHAGTFSGVFSGTGSGVGSGIGSGLFGTGSSIGTISISRSGPFGSIIPPR